LHAAIQTRVEFRTALTVWSLRIVSLGISSRDRVLFAIILAGILSLGAFWLLGGEGRNLFGPRSENPKGSFGLMIPGYRAVTFGGELDNSIDGTMGGEDLLGGGGDDEIHGREGDDFVNGELGNDVLEGGPGRDIVMGGPGDDTIIGIDSYELVDGGDGEDTLIIPYSCRKFSLEGTDPGRKTIRSGCGIDLITVISVEHLIVEPAPMQGPHPRPRTISGAASF
jgi:RTX calcium-binding nonapeptide repeat (4 copies)